MTLSFAIHIILHMLVPILVAALFYREQLRFASLMMLAGWLIDFDHLLVTPIIDQDRCSIGFHLLHRYWLVPIYTILALIPKTRLIGLGLLIHIVLDWIDCYL
ncbi:DUF6122 family protein [Pontibacter indicus]|uniref:LexA-binding, inner membrane-associated hydrolase n=1 Tax=Pontibacter indicus TaxID=1317125 RepID=A0A1R3WH79_9BACT|nr:DUF6122 family protein [Pontibacter indicus]SIT77265.1 hypothetical protein SAMN05444128_0464 [Pontibacter indicus]